jgi:hypothetical protein
MLPRSSLAMAQSLDVMDCKFSDMVDSFLSWGEVGVALIFR